MGSKPMEKEGCVRSLSGEGRTSYPAGEGNSASSSSEGCTHSLVVLSSMVHSSSYSMLCTVT